MGARRPPGLARGAPVLAAAPMSGRRVRAGAARRAGAAVRAGGRGRAGSGTGRDGAGDGAGAVLGAAAVLGAGLAAALLPPARHRYVRRGARGARGRSRLGRGAVPAAPGQGQAWRAGGAALPSRPVPGPPAASRRPLAAGRGRVAAEVSVCSRRAGAVAVMSVDVGSESVKIAIVKPGVPMEIVLNK